MYECDTVIFFLPVVVSWICIPWHKFRFLFVFIHHHYPKVSIFIIWCFVWGSFSLLQFRLYVCQLSFCLGWICIHCQLVWEVKWVGFPIIIVICVFLFLFMLMLILLCHTFSLTLLLLHQVGPLLVLCVEYFVVVWKFILYTVYSWSTI